MSDKIDAYITSMMQDRKIPGLAFAIVENGTVVMKRAYGMANLETETPVKVESVFELASLTKPFTATAIMMLVEEGKVKLDDLVSQYLPDSPKSWKDITIRHLLTHTAGLPEYLNVTHDGSALMDLSAKQEFDWISSQPLSFPAGEGCHYSDAGYILLGLVIERVSGQTYREFIQKRIFDPLQMTHSNVLDQSRIVKNRVAPYTIKKGELLRGRRDWQVEVSSGFGLMSTLDDLAKFDAALTNTILLRKQRLEQMWTPAKLKNGQEARVFGNTYGFGWILSLFSSPAHRAVSHGGHSGTYVLRFPDDEWTVIILTNLDYPSGRNHPFVLAEGIISLVKPELLRSKMDKSGLTQEEVTFVNGQVTLAGTVRVPPGTGPFPAVVMVHGSGPQDRRFYEPISRLFARGGIAVLTYDKRGCGASSGDWRTAGFTELAEDALAGVRCLQGRQDIRPRQVGLWGLSQGGWVAPLAASRSTDVAFIISVSGAGCTPAQQVLYCNEHLLRQRGVPEAAVQEFLEMIKSQLELVRTGKGQERYDQLVHKVRGNPQFRLAFSEFMPADMTSEEMFPLSKELIFDRLYREDKKAIGDPGWFLHLPIDHDPALVLEKVTCPVLAMWGEDDLIVPVKESVAVFQAALKRGGNRRVTLEVVPKGDHMLSGRHNRQAFDTMVRWMLDQTVEGKQKSHE